MNNDDAQLLLLFSHSDKRTIKRVNSLAIAPSTPFPSGDGSLRDRALHPKN